MLKSAKGQITLVSLADGSTAMFYISPNKSTQQIWDSTSYMRVPDYEQDPLTLTAHLTIGGVEPTNILWQWKEGDTILGSDQSLVIDQNLTVDQRFIRCIASYADPNSKTACKSETSVVLSRITTSGSEVNVLLQPEQLDYVDQDNSSVTLKAYAYYGSGLKENNGSDTAVQYSWGIYNSVRNKFTGFVKDDNVITGIIDTSNVLDYNTTVYYKRNFDLDDKYGFVVSNSSDYDVCITNNTIVMKKDAIDVKETIRCQATVFNAHSNIVKETVGSDTAIYTVRDLTDIYTVSISATSSVLTPSVSATKLVASLLQNGVVVTKSDINYDWDAYSINSVTGEAAIPWNEYRKEGDSYIEILGDEKGIGYWLKGNPSNPEAAVYTGDKNVTIYREWVGNSSNIQCTITW